MPRQPTAEDANLILRLYELRREPRMREARRWLISSFKARTHQGYQRLCPPGSEESASYRMVSTYWEMAASFVVAGVLHENLFFDNSRELLVVWELIREVAAELRTVNGDATYLANLEQVAGAYASWLDRASPGAHQALAARIRGQQAGAQPGAPPTRA